MVIFACSIIRYWHDTKCSTCRRKTIWALRQNGGTVWLKVQHLAIWYHIENLLHLYKPCLQKWTETWSWTFSTHDLYKWSRFSSGYQMTRYGTLSQTFRPFLALKSIFEERSHIMRDVSNKLFNIDNIFIRSPCNDGYPGSCGRF